MSVDTVLGELFLEEATPHAAALPSPLQFVATVVAQQRAIADELNYIRSAAICAELLPLARVLDVVETRAQAASLDLPAYQVAWDWVQAAVNTHAEDLGAWSDRVAAAADALLEAWSNDKPPVADRAADGFDREMHYSAPAVVDEAMLALFRSEVETHTFTMSDGLIAIDADPGATERLDAVMRAAHSIKGAVRILNLDPAVALAHVAEELVQQAIVSGAELDPNAIDALLRACDVIGELAHAADPRAWAFAEGERFVVAAQRIHALGSHHQASAVAASNAAGLQPSVTANSVLEQPSQPSRTPRTNAEDEVRDPSLRAVKVTAVHLDRLLGLAGESVTDARRLAPFAASLHQVYLQQTAVLDLLSDLRLSMGAGVEPARVLALLARARAKADLVRGLVSERHREADALARSTDDLSRRLYRETIESRMRPFRDGVQWFPRLVHDLSRKLAKLVDFRILGESVRVDRDILEKIEAPLNHLLRNALDHGIETADERARSNKAPRSTLTLEARHWAGMLSVSLSDDGRGIDVARVRQKIVERGLAEAGDVVAMSEPQVLEYLFAPGFSTRDAVSETSGRGVGLDVVKTAVHEVGGSVRVHSTAQKGTTFQLLLPLTLSVTRSVIVYVSGEVYAVPLVRVHRLVRVDVSELVEVEGRLCVNDEGERVGLVSAAELLELPVPAQTAAVSIVILRNYQGTFGVVVDSFAGEQDLVVRTLDPRLGRVADVLAASILPDGAPVLILDSEDVIRSAVRLVEQRRPRSAIVADARLRRRRVLIVDDSVTVREVQRQLLLANGYDVTVAVDGVEGWQVVRDRPFDLVITDVDMPRMDGLELTRSIRRDSRLSAVPIVVVSYRDRPEDRVRAEDAGATRYLAKSEFQEETLLAIVAELIGGPR